MMKEVLIPVTVNEGMFSSEKNVSFDLNGTRINLVVDSDDVQGANLKVKVLEETKDRLFIELPREPFSGSGRLVVNRSMLTLGS
jgi:hypothetical protein